MRTDSIRDDDGRHWRDLDEKDVQIAPVHRDEQSLGAEMSHVVKVGSNESDNR